MLALLILSIALAMDAFAVSLVRGSTGAKSVARAVELGTAFGVAQGLMPLLGWGLGRALEGFFQAIDHWVAFILLVALGLRMIREALNHDEDAPSSRSSHLVGLALAALATSVDAAAAGLTLPLLGVAIPLACFVIGVTTGLLCTAGYLLGSRVSGAVGKRAELIGGLILIGLGTKILLEHLAISATGFTT